MLQTRLAHGEIVLPKPRPIIGIKRGQTRVTRNHRAQVRPRFRRLDQSRAERIQQHVIRAGQAERVALAFLGCEDVVVRLVLKPCGF